MNRHFHHYLRIMTRPHLKAGSALLIVLAFLVLITALVLALFANVNAELGQAKNTATSSSVRQLADAAMNVVVGSIAKATTLGNNVAWTSQPGLIRTYADASLNASSSPYAFYKLYSSNNMVVTPAQGVDLTKYDPAADPVDIDINWQQKPAIFTDINAPVVTAAGSTIFPIIDGNDIKALNNVYSDSAVTPAPGSTVTQPSYVPTAYWGYDSQGTGYPDIEGFSINPSSPMLSYQVGTTPTPTNTPVAMPVQWLYQLRDGTLISPDATTGATSVTTATFNNSAVQPSATNPIVGRIAFWTDDETAKININTASEGTDWSTPVAISSPPWTQSGTLGWNSILPDARYHYELDLDFLPGRQNEYPRYPGHPSTTSLSPVLWSALAQSLGVSPTDPTQRVPIIQQLDNLTPRVTAASSNFTSEAGTQNPSGNSIFPNTANRLYADVDELAYSTNYTSSVPPARTANPLYSAGSTSTAATGPTVKLLQKAKFFLTANSRAPEVNLFNQPRVSIWPLTIPTSGTDDGSRETTLDKTIKFCSTVGTGSSAQLFEFTRSNPFSPSSDFTQGNLDIYSYLEGLASSPIPGFGGNFATKYPQGTISPASNPVSNPNAPNPTGLEQILTEIFDYIRCTNLNDVSTFTDPSSGVTKYAAPYAGGPPTSTTSATKPQPDLAISGQVTPIIHPNGSRGFGRIATVNQFVFLLQTVAPTGPGIPFSGGTPNSAIEAVLMPQLFSPMCGFPSMALNMKITFKNLSNLKVDTISIFKQNPVFNPTPNNLTPNGGDVQTINFDGLPPSQWDFNSSFGGIIGTAETFSGTTVVPHGTMPDPTDPKNSNYVSGTSLGVHTIGGGPIEVIVQAPDPDPSTDPNYYQYSQVVQDFNITFPQAKLQNISNNTYYWVTTTDGTTWVEAGNFNGNEGTGDLSHAVSHAGGPDGESGPESGVSLQANGGTINIKGDSRFVAAVGNPTAYFAPDQVNYNNGTAGQDIRGFGSCANFYSPGTLLPGSGAPGWGSSGTLVDGNGDCYSPNIPCGINGVTNVNGDQGDFDNSSGLNVDGPMVNKVDEGTGFYYIFGDKYTPDSTIARLSPSTVFSPNKQVPSAVTFGSLPTGIVNGQPWQTLLFRPATLYFPGGVNHPGAAANGNPPDHLFLDLFWMPVVEPYPISEPLSTAGKINLNYQIEPFNYISRKTGLYGVLKSVGIPALNPQAKPGGSSQWPFYSDYKAGSYDVGFRLDGTIPGQGILLRRQVDIYNTLRLMDDYTSLPGSSANAHGPFISASQICDIPLVPVDIPTTTGANGIPPNADLGVINAGITNTDPVGTPTDSASTSSINGKLNKFWNANIRGTTTQLSTPPPAPIAPGNSLTGDNSLERPYAEIYPRLTTKSDTYTVHVRVQTLQKAPGTAANQWVEGSDTITGEYRGSYIIERYLDPDAATTYNRDKPNSVLGPYGFRVIATKRFGG